MDGITRGRQQQALRGFLRRTTALSTRALVLGPLLGAALLGPLPAGANPSGSSVVGGSATVAGEGSAAVTVTQSSDRAVINWADFSIGAGETTTFNQPNAGSVTLNRVTGPSVSDLQGTLRANGNVWLINPNGVVVGNGATIDVGGFLATTADILDGDFFDGDDKFDFNIASSVAGAGIANAGTITVADTGLAALVAPGVENSGTISANLGTVMLGGAETFALDLGQDGLLMFALGTPVTTAPGDAVDLVSNSGDIIADGGTVIMAARAAAGVVDNVINMSGVIQAATVSAESGTIVLSGGDQGVVRASGTLTATGDDAGETGGSVQLLGDTVALDGGAAIDVSGAAGGGTVLVGGAFQGSGPQPNASRAFVGGDASIAADATSDGDGGNVVVWSDNHTEFYGAISAQGGAQGGDGGFVEVSGKEGLVFHGTVTTAAPAGAMGTLLLDPTDIVIADGSGDGAADGSTTFAGSPSGTTGTVTSSDTGPTTIFESELEALGAATNISLAASNDITLANLTDNTLNLATTGSVTFTADADSSGAGAFIFTDTNDLIQTAGANLTISGASLTLGNLSAAAISLTATNSGINLNDTTATGTLNVNSAGAVTDSGTLSVTGTTAIQAAGNSVTLDTAANDFASAVSSTGTDITLVDVSALPLGTVTASGNLSVTAGGTVSDSGVLTVAGTTSIQAPGKTITLNSAANDFTGAVSSTGNSVGFTDTNDIVLGTTNAGTLFITAGGMITQVGTITLTNAAVLKASGDITLTDPDNQLVLISGGTTGANLNFADAGEISLGTITASGNLTVAALSIVEIGPLTVGGVTTFITLTVDDGGAGGDPLVATRAFRDQHDACETAGDLALDAAAGLGCEAALAQDEESQWENGKILETVPSLLTSWTRVGR